MRIIYRPDKTTTNEDQERMPLEQQQQQTQSQSPVMPPSPPAPSATPRGGGPTIIKGAGTKKGGTGGWWIVSRLLFRRVTDGRKDDDSPHTLPRGRSSHRSTRPSHGGDDGTKDDDDDDWSASASSSKEKGDAESSVDAVSHTVKGRKLSTVLETTQSHDGDEEDDEDWQGNYDATTLSDAPRTKQRQQQQQLFQLQSEVTQLHALVKVMMKRMVFYENQSQYLDTAKEHVQLSELLVGYQKRMDKMVNDDMKSSNYMKKVNQQDPTQQALLSGFLEEQSLTEKWMQTLEKDKLLYQRKLATTDYELKQLRNDNMETTRIIEQLRNGTRFQQRNRVDVATTTTTTTTPSGAASSTATTAGVIVVDAIGSSSTTSSAGGRIAITSPTAAAAAAALKARKQRAQKGQQNVSSSLVEEMISSWQGEVWHYDRTMAPQPPTPSPNGAAVVVPPPSRRK